MKRKAVLILCAVVAILAGYIIFQQFKGRLYSWYADTHITRSTQYPASQRPDQVCLTWADDPRMSQAVQWRTDISVTDGWVAFREKEGAESEPSVVEATLSRIEDRMLENDPVVHRFTAHLEGLRPATSYVYRVGSREKDLWSEWSEFRTAPDAAEPFVFLYMGDPQIGLDFWGELLQSAYARHRDAAFHVISGDLVNKGSYRNEWDMFFAGARGVFDRSPIVPTPGNHDYDKRETPGMYLDMFALPQNGSKNIPPELSYSFEYGNALFISLDSNRSPSAQAEWLEKQLADSKATWKFVTYHHPAFSPKANRDNPEIRRHWTPLFDRYGVDMALEGHDHAYMRTYPMKDGKRADVPGEGTVHVVSVSGTKYYALEPRDCAEVAFADTSTYQVIAIATNPDRLTYRAYDKEGAILDELVIQK